MSSLRYRTIKDKIFFYCVCGLSSLTVIPLFAIIWELIRKGYKQINWSFFTETAPSTLDAMLARGTGDIIPGGIANGILGTLLMVAIASVIAIPVGIMVGIHLSEHPKTKFSNATRFITDLIQGSPSIVIGIIAYAWVVKPLGGYSAFAGSVSLAIITGILLAVSRVMGETAPLMLTALGSTAINWNVMEPTSAVPLLIWEFYNDPNLIDMIWSSSLFLLILVLSLNLIAKHIAKKWKIQ